MIKAGIVGMGVIGTHVAKAIDNGIPGVTLAGVSVRTAARAAAYPAFALPDLIARADLIVEAATQAALREFGPAVLRAGKDLMVLSVGALVGVLDDWARLAAEHRCRILVPSGAVAGLDGMKGAREGAITAVTMETRKPPRGLAGAPFIEQQKIIGPERTRIKIYAVPGQARNQHRITIDGEFGRLTVEIENVPSENPRTGKLSYLSAIAMLRELGAPVRVGT
jgi:aspartate dehydrogenase